MHNVQILVDTLYNYMYKRYWEWGRQTMFVVKGSQQLWAFIFLTPTSIVISNFCPGINKYSQYCFLNSHVSNTFSALPVSNLCNVTKCIY